MSSPQTVLAHLRDGREELVREVARLTTAIAELDAVIGRVSGAADLGGGASSSASRTNPSSGAPGQASSRDEARRARRGTSRTASHSGDGRARRTKSPTPRSSAAKRATQRRSNGGHKSIRIHVLEMLASENRDFGLAEIIDRIHGAGITAHDDAVRSITIKLMKDGQVERVGRGQYRLAARPQGEASGGPDPTPDLQPATDDPAPDATAASLNLAAPWNSAER